MRNNEWNDLISIMITSCKGDSHILKEGTLNALGILCEDIVGFKYIDYSFSSFYFFFNYLHLKSLMELFKNNLLKF